MVIMDTFNCKHCGKEVVLENDVDVSVDRHDFNCSCAVCYNKFELPLIEYGEYLQDERIRIETRRR